MEKPPYPRTNNIRKQSFSQHPFLGFSFYGHKAKYAFCGKKMEKPAIINKALARTFLDVSLWIQQASSTANYEALENQKLKRVVEDTKLWSHCAKNEINFKAKIVMVLLQLMGLNGVSVNDKRGTTMGKVSERW